jgi:hypothetical protein
VLKTDVAADKVFLEGAVGVLTLGDAQKADPVEGRAAVRVKAQVDKDRL